MEDHIWLAVVGLFAGLAGGLLGIGGSIIMIPAMNELFGVHQHLHQAAAMIVNFFVVVPAARQHARAKAIVWPLVRKMAPVTVASVLIGVVVSEAPLFAGQGQASLSLLFACFLACVAAADVYRMFRRRGHGTPGPSSAEQPAHATAGAGWRAALMVGVPTGLVGGLLGVGGGVVMVPLQTRLLGMPLRKAIANSATTIIALSLVGATAKNYAVIIDHLAPWWSTFTTAAVLIPTAVIGSTLGGKLTHTLPVRRIRLAFIILMFAFAARMCQRALADL